MSGIYIHIPFCFKRCNYCDFYFITNLNVVEKYLLNLKKEIELASELFKKENFDTVFFGGGTPSVLSFYQIADLSDCIYKNFSVSSEAEISLEANPEDFLENNLRNYKSAGINRISFGVQSFIDSELKFLTRQHTASQAERVIKEASKHFDNINLDIIYSLPSQTIKDTEYSLSKALEFEAKHISAYTLTFEERTLLHRAWQRNLVQKNPENTEAELYKFVSDKLTSNGFIHYEVSNFAKAGYECKHNLKYWSYANYLGLGPSSHSMFNGIRWNNFRDIVKYNSALEKNILPVENKYVLTDKQKRLEFIMLALRSTGIVFEKYENIFKERFKVNFSDSINILLQNYYAEIDENMFRLNEKGFAVADEIIAKYF